MNNKSILTSIKSSRNWVRAVLVFFLMALLLTACAQTSSTSSPDPALQPTPQSPAVGTTPGTGTDAVVSAAKSALADQLGINVDAIQLVDIQPVQWPDSCLGIHKTGIMCAFHVVDGYRITLSANGQTYEVRSNLNGSQIVLVPGQGSTSTGTHVRSY
jgi:hypothetical protein